MTRSAAMVMSVMTLGLLLGCSTDLETRQMGSGTMEPTISQGTEITIDYAAYDDARPSRGDIVAFRVPDASDGRTSIGRAVAIGGDSLRVQEGALFVNDTKMEEAYIAEPMAYSIDEMRLSDSQVFVLGDNRNEAFDSHYFGPLPSDELVGRVVSIGGP